MTPPATTFKDPDAWKIVHKQVPAIHQLTTPFQIKSIWMILFIITQPIPDKF